jgi:Fe2+ or Zn2+ uptake regulation protein
MSSAPKQPRNTKQLELIWKVIRDDKSHPTADQIYERVRKKLPTISLGTVYRNLQKLVIDEKLQVLMRGRPQHLIHSWSGTSTSFVKSAVAFTMSW